MLKFYNKATFSESLTKYQKNSMDQKKLVLSKFTGRTRHGLME
jgi:hypothetical protein